MINSRQRNAATESEWNTDKTDITAVGPAGCTAGGDPNSLPGDEGRTPSPGSGVCDRFHGVVGEWQKETAQKRNSLLGGLPYLGIRALTVVRAFLATILALTSSLAHMRSSFF